MLERLRNRKVIRYSMTIKQIYRQTDRQIDFLYLYSNRNQGNFSCVKFIGKQSIFNGERPSLWLPASSSSSPSASASPSSSSSSSSSGSFPSYTRHITFTFYDVYCQPENSTETKYTTVPKNRNFPPWNVAKINHTNQLFYWTVLTKR